MLWSALSAMYEETTENHKGYKMKEIGKTKFDVDKEKYADLDPFWAVLESVPSDMKITMPDAGKKSGLDPKKAVPLIQEFVAEFQKKMMKNLFSLIWNYDELTDSWTFDKIMLLTNRVNTGMNPTDDIDPGLMKIGAPVMKKWEDKWREKRGI